MPERLYVITLDRILKWLTIMAAGRARRFVAAKPGGHGYDRRHMAQRNRKERQAHDADGADLWRATHRDWWQMAEQAS